MTAHNRGLRRRALIPKNLGAQQTSFAGRTGLPSARDTPPGSVIPVPATTSSTTSSPVRGAAWRGSKASTSRRRTRPDLPFFRRPGLSGPLPDPHLTRVRTCCGTGKTSSGSTATHLGPAPRLALASFRLDTRIQQGRAGRDSLSAAFCHVSACGSRFVKPDGHPWIPEKRKGRKRTCPSSPTRSTSTRSPICGRSPPHEQIFGTTAIVPRHVRRAGRTHTRRPDDQELPVGRLDRGQLRGPRDPRRTYTAILMDADNCVAEGPGFQTS